MTDELYSHSNVVNKYIYIYVYIMRIAENYNMQTGYFKMYNFNVEPWPSVKVFVTYFMKIADHTDDNDTYIIFKRNMIHLIGL